MAVFPEALNKIDTSDPARALQTIEAYINYMTERIEFSTRNVTRNVSAAGVSSAEIYVLYQAQAQQLAAMQSLMGQMSGAITALSNQITSLQGSISTIQGNISTIQGDISGIQSDISDLDERVTALENQQGV